MQYIAFIWTRFDTDADVSMDELARYGEYVQAAGQAGVLRGGSALHPVSAATTIRLRDDEVLMTDGPFVESKEQLSGYVLLECADLDEALAWAARIPGARHGAVEVRPLLLTH
ncbi:YciI family protein [Frankia sp. Cr2]|uniref:YciI family protein n=1 Tax=Frankia sp. Cr2 TaxID=3073932 RepID=UPI002AD1D7A7|nr:YciI family protein [Frankia sp. Cr2]